MIGGLKIPGFSNVARSPGSTASSARLDYPTFDPGELDDDLLLVSQIGGLRAKSAQAQAASAKLTAAIDSARGQQKVHRQRFRQDRLNVLASWLTPPCENVPQIFAAWRFATVCEARSREAERAKRKEESAESKIDKLRRQLLVQRREVRVEAVRQNIKYGQKQNIMLDLPLGVQARELLSVFFCSWQWSWRLQRRGNSRRGVRSGSVELSAALPRRIISSKCLSPRSSSNTRTASANARRPPRSRTGTSPESPAFRATNGFSPKRSVDLNWVAIITDRLERFIFAKHACSSLLGSTFWAWRQRIVAVACATAISSAEEQRESGCFGGARHLQNQGSAANVDEVRLVLRGRMLCLLDGIFTGLTYCGDDQQICIVDSELKQWLLWHWRLFSATERCSTAVQKVYRRELERRRSMCECIGLSFATCIAVTAFACWRVYHKTAFAGGGIVNQRRLWSNRCYQMHLSLFAGCVLAVWACGTKVSRCESSWIAKFSHVRVLQRRALSAVLTSGLESEQSWCASQIFYIWSLESFRFRCDKLQSRLEGLGSLQSRAHSRMVALISSSQHDLLTECLALALSTWRLCVAHRRTEQLSKPVAFAAARSSFVQSRASLESLFWLRNVFEVLVIHAKTEAVLRQLQAYEHEIVNRVASERNMLCSRRSRHAERIQAHVACMERHEVAIVCFRQWLHEVESISFLKRCTNIIIRLEKSPAWLDLLPLLICWISWRSWYCCSRRLPEEEARKKEMLVKLASEKLEREKLAGKLSRQEDAFGKLCFALTREVDVFSDEHSAVRDAISQLLMSPSQHEDARGQEDTAIGNFSMQCDTRSLSRVSDDEGDESKAITQVLSPLTASSPWIVNVWNGPPTQRVAGAAAPPRPPPEVQVRQSLVCRGEQSGELTRQQEAFIAALRSNISGHTQEPYGDVENSQRQEIPQEDGACSWFDASQPLSVTKLDLSADTPTEFGEAVGAEQAGLQSDAGYWEDVSLPLFDGQQVEDKGNGTDVVRRRLSFGTAVALGESGRSSSFCQEGLDLESPRSQLEELADRRSSSIHSESARPDSPRFEFQVLADRKTSSIHEDETSGMHATGASSGLQLQEIANRKASSSWQNVSGDSAGFRLTSDALAQPINPMEEIAHNQGSHVIGSTYERHVQLLQEDHSDNFPVWRWNTWSAGDVPPSEADEDLEMVHVQTCQELESGANQENPGPNSRRPTDAQLAELRQILGQGLPEATHRLEESCLSIPSPTAAQITGLKQMIAGDRPRLSTSRYLGPGVDASMSRDDSTSTLPPNRSPDVSKTTVHNGTQEALPVLPLAEQRLAGAESLNRSSLGGVLNDMPSQLFAAKLQTFSFGMPKNLGESTSPGSNTKGAASPRDQDTVPEVLAKLQNLIGARSPQ